MTGNNLVSIVMPTYNSYSTVADSIESVLRQSYRNWELIIVDDHSHDGTWELISQYATNYEGIFVFQNKVNRGAGISRNFAIRKAKGRFIAFLDSDDLWLEDKLSKQISFMLDNNYYFTYTYYRRFTDGKLLELVRAPLSTTYKKLVYSNVIGCLTAIYDVSYLGKRYMPSIRKRQDMGLWLDILKDIPEAYCLPVELARYRVGTGMTSNKFSVLSYQWCFYREVLGLGFFRSLFTFSVYAVKGILKHKFNY
ncbi:glycosyltransferase family 2 protein [Shewanella algae]|uniref:glycosyltransferase family 2 protein n=1 Tax=Shewanella algae TaxID=38313 RepID=UPI003AAB711B